MTNTFLTAEWRNLVLANYEIKPSVLEQYTPLGTELDLWDGKALVSLVAFQFLNTKVYGIPIPYHTNFEEINLRFYVKRDAEGEERRGVVFIKELVPRFAIAGVARLLYGENYFAVPMSHSVISENGNHKLSYSWLDGGQNFKLSAETTGDPKPLSPQSEEEFILEHYWGYSKRNGGYTTEYEVRHPKWRAWNNVSYEINVDFKLTYGDAIAQAMSASPRTVYVSEGSGVEVKRGKSIIVPGTT